MDWMSFDFEQAFIRTLIMSDLTYTAACAEYRYFACQMAKRIFKIEIPDQPKQMEYRVTQLMFAFAE